MASPIAASAAATVSTSSAKICPTILPRNARERDEIEIDGEQDQLDRHQYDDHIFPVEKNAENAEREQDRTDREIVRESDFMLRSPAPI
jgi:hypothetical protein